MAECSLECAPLHLKWTLLLECAESKDKSSRMSTMVCALQPLEPPTMVFLPYHFLEVSLQEIRCWGLHLRVEAFTTWNNWPAG